MRKFSAVVKKIHFLITSLSILSICTVQLLCDEFAALDNLTDEHTLFASANMYAQTVSSAPDQQPLSSMEQEFVQANASLQTSESTYFMNDQFQPSFYTEDINANLYGSTTAETENITMPEAGPTPTAVQPQATSDPLSAQAELDAQAVTPEMEASLIEAQNAQDNIAAILGGTIAPGAILATGMASLFMGGPSSGVGAANTDYAAKRTLSGNSSNNYEHDRMRQTVDAEPIRQHAQFSAPVRPLRPVHRSFR